MPPRPRTMESNNLIASEPAGERAGRQRLLRELGAEPFDEGAGFFLVVPFDKTFGRRIGAAEFQSRSVTERRFSAVAVRFGDGFDEDFCDVGEGNTAAGFAAMGEREFEGAVEIVDDKIVFAAKDLNLVPE